MSLADGQVIQNAGLTPYILFFIVVVVFKFCWPWLWSTRLSREKEHIRSVNSCKNPYKKMITLFPLRETAGINNGHGWSFIWMTAVGRTTLLPLLTLKIPQTHATEVVAKLKSSSVEMELSLELSKRNKHCETHFLDCTCCRGSLHFFLNRILPWFIHF